MLLSITPANGVLTDLLVNGDGNAEISANGKHYVSFLASNAAGAALANFAMLAKASSDADCPWETVISGGAWAEGHSLVPHISDSDLNVLPAGEQVLAQVYIGGYYQIKFQASSSSGAGGTLSLYVNLSH